MQQEALLSLSTALRAGTYFIPITFFIGYTGSFDQRTYDLAPFACEYQYRGETSSDNL